MKIWYKYGWAIFVIGFAINDQEETQHIKDNILKLIYVTEKYHPMSGCEEIFS